MSDELKQCIDRDRCDRFENDRCDNRYDDCECGRDDEWNWGEWLPILIIVFLLCGGTNIFGGFGCRDDCCDNNNGFGGGWLLILIVIFFLFTNQGGGKDGFLGGLFG